jgi:hypothetical protein
VIDQSETAKATGLSPSNLVFTFVVDLAARKALEEEIFGKQLLFTGQGGWLIADLVGAYRSQHISSRTYDR